MQRRVQCSNPAWATAMFRTSVRDCHLGQRGCAAARGDRVFACDRANLPPVGQAGALSNSLSPMGANGRGGDHSSIDSERGPLVNIAHS